MANKENKIRVSVPSSSMGLQISTTNIKQVIGATNNRAQYFADLAKKYRDEAKQHRDNAKYYAEQNSDVTLEYISNIQNSLESKINTKQDSGNYALREEIPIKVSELENDSEYVIKEEFLKTVDEIKLPEQAGCEGKVLVSNGINESWVDIQALKKNQITNCLLEVPQKIKLELADGVLTLKSGSKAPVPNGVGVFEEVVTTKDIIIPTASGTQYDGKDFMLCIRNNGVNIDRIPYTESGTDPSNPTGEWCFYYDTAVNKIYLYNQGLLTDRYYSFPIAKLRAKLLEDGVTFTWEILQVFNGMGYIGSSLWVDKGVKGLIPSGRNEDGTLNNIEFVTSKVLTRTFPNTDNMDAIIGLNATTIGRLNITGYSFDYENNYNDNLQHPDPWMHVIVATCTETNGVISNFRPKQPVHLVDMYDVLLKSDKSEISGWGMPSTKYTNLTIGATGTYYTAPANGWFYIGGSAGANWQFVNLYNSTKKMGYTCYGANGSKPGGFVPVTKGDSVAAWYTVKTVDEFRFIYAEGEV